MEEKRALRLKQNLVAGNLKRMLEYGTEGEYEVYGCGGGGKGSLV